MFLSLVTFRCPKTMFSGYFHAETCLGHDSYRLFSPGNMRTWLLNNVIARQVSIEHEQSKEPLECLYIKPTDTICVIYCIYLA